nr:fibroblast growth factor-binding protein 1-like [Oryctolagus cuniculus]
MWTRTLTLLSVLLLAAQGLLTEAQSGEQDEVNLEAEQDGWVPLEKPVIVSTSPPTQVIVTGSFVSRDQAKCNVTVTRQEKGVHLQVDCVRLDHEFSCVFGGDPSECLLYLSSDKVYWRQIGWHLRRLNHICEDSKAILETRVCGTKYPESSLTLLSSTLASKTSVQGAHPHGVSQGEAAIPDRAIQRQIARLLLRGNQE